MIVSFPWKVTAPKFETSTFIVLLLNASPSRIEIQYNSTKLVNNFQSGYQRTFAEEEASQMDRL